MQALIATGDSRLVELRDIASPEPEPERDRVLVDVEAVSVNRGELHRLRVAPAGWRPGWDFAGKVVDGPRSLPRGTRVYGMLAEGAWASRIAAPSDHLAPLPDSVDALDAAVLPVAGLTAARVLRVAGELRGRRVLIVGAAGGVGRFAVQLARLHGARVHAHVGRPERRAGLTELGAHHVWCGDQLPVQPMDVVLDTVGGESLERAFRIVADHGVIVTYGNSAGGDSLLPVSSFYAKQATVRGYHLLRDLPNAPPAADLEWLVDLVGRGHLRVVREAPVSWEQMPQVLRDLEDRKVAGKAVLTVTDTADQSRSGAQCRRPKGDP